MDLGQLTFLTVVGTQGRYARSSGKEYARAYRLAYSRDGTLWRAWRNRQGNPVSPPLGGAITGELHPVSPPLGGAIRGELHPWRHESVLKVGHKRSRIVASIPNVVPSWPRKGRQ